MKGERAVAALLAMIAASCFAGYDSRWGEREASQRRVAKELAPASLRRAESGTAPARPKAVAELRVKVHATPRHQAENVDWKHRFEGCIADANVVLAAHGLRLHVQSVETWPLANEPDRPEDMLNQLALLDPGNDVDLVVGLVSAVPRLTATFHELGAAKVLGRHVVLRGANDGLEYQAIERGFDELEPAERAKLFALRRRHKQTAVLLHEVAHALGGLHARDRRSLLSPTYDHEMNDFGEGPARLLEVAAGASGDRARLYRDLEATLAQLPEGEFFESERRELLDFLVRQRTATPESSLAVAGRATPAPSAGPAPAAPSPPSAQPASEPEPAPPGLSSADVETYREARRLQQGSRFDDAVRLASPLFARYQDSRPVQDLRCQLAMNRKRPWDEVNRECSRLMELSMKR